MTGLKNHHDHDMFLILGLMSLYAWYNGHSKLFSNQSNPMIALFRQS